MAQLINEAKRMQLLAGLITESQLNEEPREGVYNDFSKWKASFPEGTEFENKNGYMVATKDGKELGKWNPISKTGMHADDFQYNNLEEVEVADVKVGETYIAQMPTSNDGKERVDVKVKVVGPAKELSDEHFVIEPLEDKRYTNPVSKQENDFSKGKHYNIEAKYLKPAETNESIDIDAVVNEALAKVRKNRK